MEAKIENKKIVKVGSYVELKLEYDLPLEENELLTQGLICKPEMKPKEFSPYIIYTNSLVGENILGKKEGFTFSYIDNRFRKMAGEELLTEPNNKYTILKIHDSYKDYLNYREILKEIERNKGLNQIHYGSVVIMKISVPGLLNSTTVVESLISDERASDEYISLLNPMSPYARVIMNHKKGDIIKYDCEELRRSYELEVMEVFDSFESFRTYRKKQVMELQSEKGKQKRIAR